MLRFQEQINYEKKIVEIDEKELDKFLNNLEKRD